MHRSASEKEEQVRVQVANDIVINVVTVWFNALLPIDIYLSLPRQSAMSHVQTRSCRRIVGPSAELVTGNAHVL